MEAYYCNFNYYLYYAHKYLIDFLQDIISLGSNYQDELLSSNNLTTQFIKI